MKYISARQAWGDAYHTSGASFMAMAIEDAQEAKDEAAKLARKTAKKKVVECKFPAAYDGESAEPAASFPTDSQVIEAYETRTGKAARNLGRCAHMLAAAKVMHAIGTLAPPLQSLGHFLYSPMAKGLDQNRAHALVLAMTELPKMQARRKEVAYWIALAAMYSFRDMVVGRNEWTPSRVITFVEEWGGCKLHQSNWERDWSAAWEAYLQQIDALDCAALAPVAKVIRKDAIAA